MKVGDIIARKDMPQFRFRILGENKHFLEFWNVESIDQLFKTKDNIMVAKDDDRWIIIE